MVVDERDHGLDEDSTCVRGRLHWRRPRCVMSGLFDLRHRRLAPASFVHRERAGVVSGPCVYDQGRSALRRTCGPSRALRGSRFLRRLWRASSSTCWDSRGSETTEALKPWRRALREARALPRRVRGPVLDRALFRFASICRDVLMRPRGASDHWLLPGPCPRRLRGHWPLRRAHHQRPQVPDHAR